MKHLKNKIAARILILVLSLITTTCQKDRLEINQSLTPSSEKVRSWLDEQSIEVQSVKALATSKVSNIQLLKDNLDFAAATTEQRNMEENLLIIPVKEELVEQKKLQRNSTLNLILIVSEAGEIRWGTLVYFLPADGKRRVKLATNTFHKILNNKGADDDGVFNFLSISGSYLYKLEYKGHKLYSHGFVRAGNKGKIKDNNNKAEVRSSCTDWYIITTYYYPDGSTQKTEEYLGTTCDGCDNGEFMSLCQNSEGGAGGGVNDHEVTSEIYLSRNEVDYGDEDLEDTGGFPQGPTAGQSYVPIRYIYHATITKGASSGIIAGVTVHPITADPMNAVYTDNYMRNVTRSLTLFGHSNSYSYLSATTVLINWSCIVNGRYTYTDGTPVWTRQWNRSFSSVQ